MYSTDILNTHSYTMFLSATKVGTLVQSVSFVNHNSPLTNFIPPLKSIRYFQLHLTEVNELRYFVNILHVIYISFDSLTSRSRHGTVDLILRKNLLLC